MRFLFSAGRADGREGVREATSLGSVAKGPSGPLPPDAGFHRSVELVIAFHRSVVQRSGVGGRIQCLVWRRDPSGGGASPISTVNNSQGM